MQPMVMYDGVCVVCVCGVFATVCALVCVWWVRCVSVLMCLVVCLCAIFEAGSTMLCVVVVVALAQLGWYWHDPTPNRTFRAAGLLPALPSTALGGLHHFGNVG